MCCKQCAIQISIRFLSPVPDPAKMLETNLPVTPVQRFLFTAKVTPSANYSQKNSTRKIKLTVYHSKSSQDGQITTDNFTKILQS